tara:strand:- start:8644 stop:9423 length:780 start_codon:yes stop_codon:yes gene_type:complete
MIEVGDWLHIEPGKLSCERINPTQLNQYKNRVQEPYLRLMIGELEVMVNGRKMFWSLLDALFPNDPLPRTPVNNFLQAEPHEFLHDLNSFFDESNTPYISIMLGEVADPFSTVDGVWEKPGAVIITANSGLKAPDCVAIADRYNGLVIPGNWRDSQGKHEVPCVLINGCIHIHDLGTQLVVGAVFKNEHGNNVRPLPADTVRKGVGWPAGLASVIDKHLLATKKAEGRLYPPSKAEDRTMRSSESMMKEFELFMRGHQD